MNSLLEDEVSGAIGVTVGAIGVAGGILGEIGLTGKAIRAIVSLGGVG